MRSAARKERAFSNITSTVILSAVLLSIMISATYMSNEVLNTQVAESEFKTAENIVTTVDSEIRKLMFKPAGSSSIIKSSFSTTAPGFTRTGDIMNVTFRDEKGNFSYPIPLNIFNIDGRRIMGGASGYDLQGNSSLLVSPYAGSFGRIRVFKPENWRVSLDYERALYAYTGKVNFYNNGEFTPNNTLEVTTILLDFGEFNVTENSYILIQNEGVVPTSLTLTGNFRLIVSSRDNTDTIYLNEMSEYPSLGTLVHFYQIRIKISVLEGG